MKLQTIQGRVIAISNNFAEGTFYTGFSDSVGNEIYLGCILEVWFEDAFEKDGGYWSNHQVEFYKGCLVCKQVGFDYEDQEEEIRPLFEFVEDYKTQVCSNLCREDEG